jgi:hypothetical protein
MLFVAKADIAVHQAGVEASTPMTTLVTSMMTIMVVLAQAQVLPHRH